MCDSDKPRRNFGEWGGEESPLESLDGKVMRKAETAAAAAAAGPAEPVAGDGEETGRCCIARSVNGKAGQVAGASGGG